MKKPKTWDIWKCGVNGCLFEIRIRTRPPQTWRNKPRYDRLIANAYTRLIMHERRCSKAQEGT